MRKLVAIAMIVPMIAAYSGTAAGAGNEFTLVMSEKDKRWYVEVTVSKPLASLDKLREKALQAASLACESVLPPRSAGEKAAIEKIFTELFELIVDQIRTEYGWSGPCLAFRNPKLALENTRS